MKYGTKHFVSREFGNSATIEALSVRAHKGAKKSQAYRLCCFSAYDDMMLYYCKIFETYKEAYNDMMGLSCGMWEEEIDTKLGVIYQTCQKM